MAEAPVGETGCALIVMGVSGSGKTTVGGAARQAARLAIRRGRPAAPSGANVEKMRQGIPLTDADRAPWLDRIGEELKQLGRRGTVRGHDLLGAQARLSRPHPLRAAGRSLRLSERLGGADWEPRRGAPSRIHAALHCCAASSTRWRSRGRTSRSSRSTRAARRREVAAAIAALDPAPARRAERRVWLRLRAAAL